MPSLIDRMRERIMGHMGGGAGDASYSSPYTPGSVFGNAKNATKRFSRQLYEEMPERYGRKRYLQGLYDESLADPTGAADMFGDYFQRAAEGYSAPALRDFTKTISGVQANAARRFGGNVSSEELRLTRDTSDDFSRNLTEALARLAPEQVSAGQRHTAQLGDAAGQAASEQDRLTQLILAALQGTGGKGIDWGKILGTVAGVALAPATGGASLAAPAVLSSGGGTYA